MSDTQDHSIYDIIYSRDELIKRIVMLRNENARLKKIIAANIEDYSCNECPYEKDCDLDMVPMHDGCRMYAEMYEVVQHDWGRD